MPPHTPSHTPHHYLKPSPLITIKQQRILIQKYYSIYQQMGKDKSILDAINLNLCTPQEGIDMVRVMFQNGKL